MSAAKLLATLHQEVQIAVIDLSDHRVTSVCQVGNQQKALSLAREEFPSIAAANC